MVEAGRNMVDNGTNLRSRKDRDQSRKNRGLWRRTRPFLRKHLFGILGIPVIEPIQSDSEEPDWVFRANLRDLELLRWKNQIDMEHLQSRHEYLGAVVKAGPYAMISSIVAVGWVVLVGELTTIIPLSAIASLVILLVVACNRLANEAEKTIGVTKLISYWVDERYGVRQEEVKAAVLKAKSKAPDIFKSYFHIQFSRSFPEGPRKQIQIMLPDAKSLKYTNMGYRHPTTFDIITRLRDTTNQFIDAIEGWREEVERKVEPHVKSTPDQDSETKEREIDDRSQSLIYCLTENLLKKSQVELHQEQGKVNSDWAEHLALIFKPPYNSLLNDGELKTKATEIEKLREEGANLKDELSREVSVLYG